VLWLCNCGAHTSAVAIAERRGWYRVKEHLMPDGSPGQGRVCAAPAERYGNGRHLLDEAAARKEPYRCTPDHAHGGCTGHCRSGGAPKPAVMHCPFCGVRHVDEGEWETRPHHKHLCLGCGKLFRFEGDAGEYFYGVTSVDVVDREQDREATWRVIGIDPEQAERDNCWQAPSVASHIAHLTQVHNAAVAYRDAVLKKRSLEAAAKTVARSGADPTEKQERWRAYRAAMTDKKAKGEALFALLAPSTEFVEAIESQRAVAELEALSDGEQTHEPGCDLQKPHYGECYVPEKRS
jgi:hypothetical protein